MAARLPVNGDRDPIRMGSTDIIVRGMRIGSCDHDHPQLAAAAYQFAECISVAEPLASMMKANLGRIVGQATARTQAHGV